MQPDNGGREMLHGKARGEILKYKLFFPRRCKVMHVKKGTGYLLQPVPFLSFAPVCGVLG